MAALDGEWTLGAGDTSTLLASIVDSQSVRRRHQFFAFTQGRLQTLLPHGVLVCGLPRSSGPRMFFDYFYSVPLPADTLARLCHPRTGVASDMVEIWLNEGANPISFSANSTSPAHVRVTEQLDQLGMGHALAHGIPSAQAGSRVHCFFGFVSMQRLPQSREHALVQTLVPHLFGAYCRALTRDPAPVNLQGVVDSDAMITEREVEILRWVRDGKSNQEIGMILGISPLTVKNHVQKILRKLQASNRTQAVTKAIALRLLGGAAATRSVDVMVSSA